MKRESNPLFEAVSTANESAEPVTAVMVSVVEGPVVFWDEKMP